MAKGGRALNSSRLCFVGQGRAGKTALARALRNMKFEPTVSTLGVSQFFVEVDNKVCLAAGDGDDEQWNELEEGESTIMSQEQASALRAAEIKLSEEQRHLNRQDSLCITDLLTDEDNQRDDDDPVAESTTTAPESTRVTSSNIELLTSDDNPPDSHQGEENLPDSDQIDSTVKTRQKNDSSSRTRDSESKKTAKEEPTTPQTLPKLKAKREKVMKRFMEFSVSKAGTKEPLRLSLWDYGGQDKFIGMHHLYLSRYCVFLLVFNMKWLLPGASQKKKDECLEYLTGWLNSISMHAVSRQDKSQAPILIIGSHKDDIENSEVHDAISKILEDHFRNHRAWKEVKIFKKSPGEKGRKSLSFFPVDNTRGQHHEKGPDPVLKQVRSTVSECIGRENYVKRKVPYTWLGAYEALQKETNSCLEFKQVKDICSENGMGTTLELNDETVMMLQFLHQMGLIMYHHETALKHLVVLDPAKFLVEPASEVVCQHDVDESEDFSPPQKRLDLMQTLESQKPHQCEDLKKGILHRKILREFLWRDVANNRDELEMLMTKYQLMVPLTNEDDEDRFLVPCLLPEQEKDQVNDHRAGPVGLKWKEAGSEKPTGTEIKNELLAAALENKVEFKKEGWERFQVASV